MAVLVCLAQLVPFCSTGDFPDSVRRTEDTERRLSGSCVSSLVFGRLSQGCAADRCFRVSLPWSLFKQRGKGHSVIRQVTLGTLIDVANREVEEGSIYGPSQNLTEGLRIVRN